PERATAADGPSAKRLPDAVNLSGLEPLDALRIGERGPGGRHRLESAEIRSVGLHRLCNDAGAHRVDTKPSRQLDRCSQDECIDCTVDEGRGCPLTYG